jgi:hypothetical protein
VSLAHRQFGSISAVFSAGEALGQLRADAAVLHTVATLEDVTALIDFWRAQRAAPSAPAILEALGWIRERLKGHPAPRRGDPHQGPDHPHARRRLVRLR